MPDLLKTSLSIVLSQLPLAGGGWLWWTDRVQVRPLHAAIIFGGYEAAVFAGAFARKVWKDELEKDAVKVTADWVRGLARGVAPGFRRRYREQVIQDHGIFNVRGLGLINTYTLKLDQVFVDLRIDPSNPQRFNVDPIARNELAGNRPVWDFLRANSGVREATALAIIGPPGCGKTTLLQHLAVTLAMNRQRRHKVRAYTPVLLFLRDHVRAVTREQAPALGALVQGHFGDRQAFPTLKTPPGWFERQLERGKCLVLLDGLDEVADADERRRVSAWVDAQIKSYPRCRFVLTARPQGYSDAPLQRAHVLEVQPFNHRQVRRFVDGWYLANEVVASGGRADAGARARARNDAEDLLRRLQALPSLAALTVNPLLLTMIAMVHRYHGALPGTRVELYAEICEVLLGRWRQARGIHDPLKTNQKLVVLRPLAAHMMERKTRDIKTAEAVLVIAEPLARVGVAGEAAGRFLSELQSGSGLLLEREAGEWSFAHLTFQEYLTAAHWLGEKGAAQDWGLLVGDSWWHETLRLYAAQGDATPLVRACLGVDTVPALTLAADFLEEARELHPGVRRAAEQRLVEDLEADDPARRRLAAEVRLSRRLNNLYPLDDRREIDLDFITCAEYQLFLDDMSAQGRYYQPDHWAGLRFADGEALRPVTGVRPADAEDFCRWLTQKSGGTTRYRLPNPSEAEHGQVKVGTLAAWCRTASGYSLVGLTPEEARSLKQLLAGLSSLPPPPTLALAWRSGLGYLRGHNLARFWQLIHALAAALTLAEKLSHSRLAPVRFSDLNRSIGSALSLHLSINEAAGGIEIIDHVLSKVDARGTPIANSPDARPTLAIEQQLGVIHGLILELVDIIEERKFGAPYAARADDRASIITETINEKLAPLGEKTVSLAYLVACLLRHDPAAEAINKGDLEKARGLVPEVNGPTPDLVDRGGQAEGAAALPADVLIVTRRAQLKHVSQKVKADYLRHKEGEADKSWWQRWLTTAAQTPEHERFESDMLEAYWWLKLVEAREAGLLPAWEGIRVVREQVTEEAKGERHEGRGDLKPTR